MIAADETVLHHAIIQLMLDGEAQDAWQAEEIYLGRNLDQVIKLVNSPTSDDDLRRHPLIQILLSHGSRPFEESD